MKNVLSLFIAIVLLPIYSIAQSLDNLDFISPFSDGVAAIKKDNQWAFINEQGTIVIDFREDVLLTKFESNNYPVFKDGRCIIKEKKDGINYFGFINTSGETVIAPKYLNASNFNKGYAVVLKLTKEKGGRNDVIGKNAIYYKYYEVTIDTKGDVKEYLIPEGTNVILDKKYLREPPKIVSKKISDNLVMTKNKNGTWSLSIIN